MALRGKSNLPRGMSLVDFASPAKIRHAFGDNMSKIRAEYSRQRSIIRKRLERMEKAGETYNWLYRQFADMDRDLPSLKGLSDAEVMRQLTRTSMALSGAYHSTVKEIREARLNEQRALYEEAKLHGDIAMMMELDRGISASDWDRINQLTDILRNITGKTVGSGDTRQAATKAVLGSDRKESLLTLAKRAADSIQYKDEKSGDSWSLSRLLSD